MPAFFHRLVSSPTRAQPSNRRAASAYLPGPSPAIAAWAAGQPARAGSDLSPGTASAGLSPGTGAADTDAGHASASASAPRSARDAARRSGGNTRRGLVLRFIAGLTVR